MELRYLTDDEIENIIDFIKPNRNIPIESAQSIVKNNKDRLIKQLKTQQIYPYLLSDLKKQLHDVYIKTQIEPGESVGIIAAMAIGEKQTQNSVVYSEEIIIKKNNKIHKTTIGELIDREMVSVVPDYNNNYIKRVNDIQVLTSNRWRSS